MSACDKYLDEWVGFAEELAEESRKTLFEMASMPEGVTFKPDRSFVTRADAEIERRLRGKILSCYPDHGIIGEEEAPLNPGAELVWVIDPIDGTAPFIAGVPVYGTLICLAAGGVPILGIIDVPAIGQRWVGAQGRLTECNGVVCRARSCEDIREAILSTSNPDFYSPEELPVLESLRAVTAWRIYGGACLSYGLLTSGRIDIAVDAGFKVHDLAPYRPIIEGAGGVITDWEGCPLTLESGPRILAAGSASLHEMALDVIRDLVV